MKLASVLFAAATTAVSAQTQNVLVTDLVCYTTTASSPQLDPNFSDPVMDHLMTLADVQTYDELLTMITTCTAGEHVDHVTNGDYTFAVALSQADGRQTHRLEE